MGISSCLGKMILVTINIGILLLSIAMIICGIIVVCGKDIYNSALKLFQESLEEALKNVGVNADTSNLTFTEVMLPLAYGVIAVGVIMGSLALIGCIGGCYSIKFILIVYATITTVFFLIQIAIVIVLFVDKGAFDNVVKPNLKKSLKEFSDVGGKDPATLIWNAIMNYEECCGIDSYKDFYGLENWPPTSINNKTVDLETPIMCCKNKTQDYSCAEKGTANEQNNWYNTGCYEKLFYLVVEHKFVVTIIVLLLTFQLIMVIVSTLTICTMDNKIL